MIETFEQRVRIQIEDATARLTLTRPDKHNGVDPPLLRAMMAAQRSLKKQREVRAVLIHGEGPSFCSGIDARAFTSAKVRAALFVSQLWWPKRNWFQAWSMGFRELGVPVIAAVHGNCFGAGMQLALGADVRIARPDARLSIMEARLGLVPDMGGPTLLRELVPIDVAKELTMTGRVISGERAQALGLVTHVSEDPLAAARELASEIATRSPDAVAAGKFLLQRAWEGSERSALAYERLYQRRVIGRDNQRRALLASQKKDAASARYAPRRIDD